MSSAPISDATVIPRVGVAVLLVDHRGYILIGKRIGSHGSGTLALPGGHLELNETFEQCAARELQEETGISIGNLSSNIHPSNSNSNSNSISDLHHHSSYSIASHGIQSERESNSSFSEIKYLTTLNSPNMLDGIKEEKPRHYVTIFMKANVAPIDGEEEVVAEVLEPNKCLGWLWVPLSYLESVAAAQSSMQRLRDAAEQEGHALPVSLEKMLEAQRLAEAMRESGEFKTFERERIIGEELTEQREQSILTNLSILKEQESRGDTLERRPILNTSNINNNSNPSSPMNEVSSPLSLSSSIEPIPKNQSEPSTSTLPSGTAAVLEEEDDEGPLPEAIQNLHAGRVRKSTSHSRSTSLNHNNVNNGTPLSPLRTSYVSLQQNQSDHHHLLHHSPSSSSSIIGLPYSTNSSPILNRSSLPRSPFLYQQDSGGNSSNHSIRSPSSSSFY